MSDTPHRQFATDMLVSYFKRLTTQLGLPWDADNTADIRVAIDALIDAAVEKAKWETVEYLNTPVNERHTL